MAMVQTTDKWTAVHAFINTWLADNTLYCNNCNDAYISCCDAPRPVLLKRTKVEGEDIQEEIVLHCKHCGAEIWQCCDNPQIGTNKDHTYALIRQNKEVTKDNLNQYGSTKDKSLRFGLSLPPRLYHDLNKYFKSMYQQSLFEEKKDLHTFMKRFPAFKIGERI